MRIHFVTPYFSPVMGGVETHVFKLSRILTRTHSVTVHTSLYTPTGIALKQSEEIEHIAVLRYKPLFHFGYYRSLFLPEITDCDVLHLHAYGHLTNDYVIWRYQGKTPIVYTFHHGPQMPKPGFRDYFFHAIYAQLAIRNLRKIDKIILRTEEDRDWLVRNGVSGRKIEISPSGIDDTAFETPSNTEEILRNYNISADFILYVGRLHPHKSVSHLIEAFSKLNKKYKDLKLVIVGPDDGDLQCLSALVRKLDLEQRIIFTGAVADEIKTAFYSACKFVVLPSVYEAEGTVIVEAWAQGKPAIATEVGGIRYLITDGKNGFLYHYGDIVTLIEKMEFLLENPNLCAEMGNDGKEIAWKKHRFETVVAQLEQIYLSILRN